MKENDDSIQLMLAYLCIAKEAEASLVRKIEILDRFGLTDTQISKVCGAGVQSIYNARQVLKKGSRGKKKK